MDDRLHPFFYRSRSFQEPGASAPPGPADLSDPSALLSLLNGQTELLLAQKRELELLKSSTQHSPQPPLRRMSTVSALQPQSNPVSVEEEQKRIWQEEILPCRDEQLLRSFIWRKGLTLEDLLSPNRPWNTWSYHAAYPNLSTFLSSVSLNEASKSQVLCEDFNERGLVSRWQSTEGILNHASMWSAIGTCPDEKNADSELTVNASDAFSRILRIVDLSPIVTSVLLGSTPRVNLSKIALFLERYLSFSNYGKASLFGIRSKTANSYLFEYHLAFYFVPQTAMDRELVVKDFRGLRRSAAFGPALNKRNRYIYEEQLSFILVGVGNDVYTCYQLAEKYFAGPYITGTGRSTLFVNPDGRRLGSWTPASIFLSWIMVAMHHVQLRWQMAIDAVDAQIDSPSQIIFSEENPDLLSDDPQFSRSKTYFWALQAYKMFDEALTATIDTWFDFRQNSLHCLNDGRMPAKDWEDSIRSIDHAVEKLQEKLLWIRKKSIEVRDLRDGLFGASSLFDSRTTVRQGDNIRLLTYITLLFLPLSFCTSIFGMQTLIPHTLPMSAFAITMPSITVFTVLLVFNLQTIMDAFEKFGSDITRSMRELMKSHNRQDWRDTANALHVDRIARQPPVKRTKPQSSHWVYALFVLEAITVSFPVSEIENAYRRIRSLFSQPSADPYLLQETAGIPEGEEAATLSRAQKVKYAKEAEKRRNKQSSIRHFHPLKLFVRLIVHLSKIAVATMRTILLVIWIPLVMLEYGLLLCWFFISPPTSLFGNPEEDEETFVGEDGKRGNDSRRPARPTISIWSLAPQDPQNPTVTIFILPFRWLGFAFAQPKKAPRRQLTEEEDLYAKRVRTLSDFTRHTRSGLNKLADTKTEEDPLSQQASDKSSQVTQPQIPSQMQSAPGTAFEMNHTSRRQSLRRWHRAQRHQASRLNEGLNPADTAMNIDC
ncbi:hypothetical protein DTO166G5_4729 [Paecilomyces variotii]|nr:hypothetical protein DTO169E5_7533 [Paecilomyces variotii]KAJ9235180.1 hypothetical protein DTO166G5_4729 [Paecilomyces variotii]KAJ9248723.1 hypothetical protein DTO207G8_7207 [Paecilomyces variotii]KAJ9285980.1 hypothetical protein DTO021C3_6387 [Paecilomyces variotii]KAJ9353388.1 hypothetical protein DTO027B9_5315 [Paecilomyces variotii]